MVTSTLVNSGFVNRENPVGTTGFVNEGKYSGFVKKEI